MAATAAGMGARVWLVAPEWRVRALTRAQLLEEGYAVTAMAGWEELEARLREEEVMPPALLIAELTGDEPPAALALLRGFPARRLVLRGLRAPDAAALQAAGIEAVLSRPYTVGEVTRAAGELLRGTGHAVSRADRRSMPRELLARAAAPGSASGRRRPG